MEPSAKDRNRLRTKQDHLLHLARSQSLDINLHIADDYPGSPTLKQLSIYLFPEWEQLIDKTIIHLKSARGQ